MGILRKRELLERVISALSASGWGVLYLGEPRHPFRLQVYREDESYRVIVYIWNVTHGGGMARPADELRIQVTGTNHFEQEAGTRTLVLGWWQEGGVFAGFDVRRHSGTLGFSPSLQIRRGCLEKAADSGFWPCNKGNQELAIAFRPDFIGQYIRSLEELHDFGESEQAYESLAAVAKEPTINADDLPISPERREVVAAVSRRLRDARFRERVLAAYSHRCAFCGLQLGLVDAAHIVPVSHPEGTDLTCNGLALCALHHRAFDGALVTIWNDYSVHTNMDRIASLVASNLHGGMDIFRLNLRSSAIVPEIVSDRPHLRYIDLGNEIRGWRLE